MKDFASCIVDEQCDGTLRCTTDPTECCLDGEECADDSLPMCEEAHQSCGCSTFVDCVSSSLPFCGDSNHCVECVSDTDCPSTQTFRVPIGSISQSESNLVDRLINY